MGKERRVLRRVEAEGPVYVCLMDSRHNPVGKEMRGSLHDLSPGGCAFRLTSQLLVGKNVQVRIELNKELADKYKQKELLAHGPVIRATREGQSYLVTMRFLIDH